MPQPSTLEAEQRAREECANAQHYWQHEFYRVEKMVLAEQDRVEELERQLAAAKEAVREQAKRLGDFYTEWGERIGNGKATGDDAGDWKWIAQHLLDIARAGVEAEMSDELKERKRLAIENLSKLGADKGGDNGR